MNVFGDKILGFSLCPFAIPGLRGMPTGVSDQEVQTEGEGSHSELMEDTQFSSHIRMQFKKEISKMSQLLCAVRHRNISEEPEQNSPSHGHFMSKEKPV